MMIELKDAAFTTWPTLDEHDAMTVFKNLSHAEIDDLEIFHIHRNTHPLFRLVSSRARSTMDEKLAKRGYIRQEGAVVMTLPLTESTFATHYESLDDALTWLQACQVISHPFTAQQQTHLCRLLRIQGSRSFAVLHVPIHHSSAISLSERLGFQRSYQYWYRSHPLSE
jgi:hypothetical protein